MLTETSLPTANSAGERIAIIVDSCCDVIPTYLEKYPYFVIPVMLNYPDRTYLDRIEITPAEVYGKFPDEIPTTSTPTPAMVHDVFRSVVDAGYTHAICVNISSALSSTLAVTETVAADYPQLTTEIIDTLNIGLGAGLTAMYAAELMEKDIPFQTIVDVCREIIPGTHSFIIPYNLDYIYKGGRISSTVYQLSKVLNMVPVITCDQNGYYTVCAKARGRKKAIKKVLDIVEEHIVPGAAYRIALTESDSEEDYAQLLERVPGVFPDAEGYIDGGDMSPALVVHAGPGLLGVGIQNLPHM